MSIRGIVRSLVRTIFIFAMSSVLAGLALAQAVSQINGTVRDSSGAVIPGVEVTATQSDTGLKRSATTDENGNFTLPNLATGPYRLEAAKMGFRTYVQTGIVLQVDSNPSIPVTLGVGDVNQSVEVEANATLVETQKLGVGTVMESQRILDLPLNGRTPTDLIALTGAAVQTGTSPVWSMNTGVTISVAGGQNYGVYYGLDGAPNINLYDSTNMPLPFPDALLEFKVETSTQNAQTGTHSGAQVNAVTRSGTNSIHGDAFEFLRNGDLNARNFFAASRDTLKRNQFGGTIGGPILKNKLFFFGGYQGTTIRQTPISSTAFVPTAQMEAGDFSVYASAQCQGRQVTLKAPFVNNQITVSQMSPAALKIASKLPVTADPCGKFLTGNLVSQYQWQVPFRIDYQLSDKHSIFGRYLGTKINTAMPYSLSPSNILTTTSGSTDDLATSVTLGDTYLIGSTKVNAFRASLGRIGADHEASDFFGPTDVGINAFSNLPHQMLFTVTGAFSLGASLYAHEPIHFTFLQFNDDFTWIHGGHQIALGGNFAHSLVDITANVRSIGNYTINGQTTGLALADFLTGNLSQMRQSAENGIIVAQYLSGIYAQDTWKLRPRLTMTYGLRWEPFTPMQVKDGKVYTFDLGRYNAGLTSTVYHGAPAGFYYPGDPGFNGKAGMNAHFKNFEPRVGLAWDPVGDGKTSIRVGAGISYDFVNEQIYANENNVAPFSGDTTVNGPVPLDNPWQGFPGGNPFPYHRSYTNPIYTVGAVYMPVPANLKTPEVYTWNAVIQRQFSPNLFASISYVGTQAIHLWDATEWNPGVYIPGSCAAGQYGLAAPGPCSTTGNVNSRRVLNLADPVKAQYISNLTAFDDGATANYNGMILATAWRATRSVTINANYTWSHCIGDQNWGGSIPNPGQNYVHLNNRGLDRGNCSYATASSDRRNLFNLTVVAQTPKFSNRGVNAVVSGWTASAIYRFSSGQPLSILSGLDQALVGFSQQRANQVSANTMAANQGSQCANSTPCVAWLNTAGFQQPATGTFGNMGVYNVLGPRFFQFDVALVRQFRVVENQHVELRAEAFNLTNSVRFNNPGVTLSTPSTFGIINSAQDPRILQMALKYTF